ncbi:hypothetical protein DL96DRAFT_1116385 [Flagelloscypha sp. PMI_526]|nr:hypothetical protein DL96DRAFT_1116385 [Flagelloscypha sp. PMI_526]
MTVVPKDLYKDLDLLVPKSPTSPVLPTLFKPDTLSPAEVADVRKAVFSAHQNLYRLDSLEAKLKELQLACASSRQENKQFIGLHQPLLRSARSLPAELWRAAFEWYLLLPKHTPKFPDSPGGIFRSASTRLSPLVLTHVSKAWRQIAIHHHQLWCDIDLVITQSCPKSLLPLLNMWLTRSGRLPLNVSFRMMTLPLPWIACPPDIRGNIGTCLNMLVSHSRRWKTVDFQITIDLYRSQLFPIKAPLLEKAKISTQECVGDPPVAHLVFFEPAPRLQTLELHNFVPPNASFLTMVPLGSLTMVTLGSFADKLIRYTSQNVLDLLLHCPLLTEMRVRCQPVTTPAPYKIDHENLTNLYIQSRGIAWLEGVTMPKLKQFEIWQSTDADTETLTSFIRRSPNLHTIRAGCDLTFLTRISPDSPIQKLELGFLREDHRTAVNMEIMEQLSQPETPILPQLRNVTIDIQFQEPDVDPLISLRLHSAIVSLARDRLGPNALFTPGLDMIMVRFNRAGATDLTIEAFRSLRELELVGLKLIFI